MRYVQDRIDPDFTIIRPDARAYPEIGYPSLAVLRAAGLAEFTYNASITVPESHTVASVGRLVDRRVSDGLATFVYASQKPSRRMDFAIARYDVLEDGANRVFFFPRDAAGARRVLGAVEDSRRLYTEWFGPLQDSTGFTVIEIPDGWGSQKDVTGIIQTAAAFRDPARAREVYHEVAHFWAPSVIDQPSPRWDEGLASFLEYRVGDHLLREEAGPVTDRRGPASAGSVAARVAALLQWIRENFEQHPERQEIALSEYGEHRITDLSYSVGMLLFAVLDELVGEEQFNRIMGEYHQRFAATGTDEFVVLARSLSNLELGPFFHDWMYTTQWYHYVRDGATREDLVAVYRPPEQDQ
jgi:aminopeptidase N